MRFWSTLKYRAAGKLELCKEKAAALVTNFQFGHQFPVKPVGFVAFS